MIIENQYLIPNIFGFNLSEWTAKGGVGDCDAVVNTFTNYICSKTVLKVLFDNYKVYDSKGTKKYDLKEL